LGAILQQSVANTHKKFALEILMTMEPILDEGVSSLSFRLEGDEQVVPYEYIKEIAWFSKGIPETSRCAWRHIEKFLDNDRGRS
jgi:hypothetical protein